MRIDSHQHFWNLKQVAYPWLDTSFGSICRSIEPGELEPHLESCGIDKTVIVQSMNSYEDTVYMLKTAETYEWVGGVVGWVPLNIPEMASEKLQEFSKNPYFKGVRHLIHEEKNPDWIIQEHVIDGLKVLASFGMTFDLVAVFPNHLKHVPHLSERVPDLKMVIDHLGKPPIKEQNMGEWAKQIAEASENPNVYAKISGLNTAADWDSWSSKDIKPYIDFAMEKFGANRLMFGSDWPVANLAGNYMKVWEETNKAIESYPKGEIEAILGGTAAAFYRIESNG
ncbi:amidohydrolase family protein [Mesobacillus foraminis]|uniref:amidohydrolase family protein n=1 Tax=Mesobacillus foraminis TaxID=279826 RepID=UPI001BE5E9B4|nr:amidohydrolase family protein [Mesobacillus foraminis]MBT2757790.1 amidohydrolase family protein [Mesobacillus foraminis]